MSRRRGITLVEVLVAAVVAGAGIALVSSGISGAVRAEVYAADLTRAADHLELLLARLDSLAEPLEDGAGTFEEEGAPDLAWEVALGTTDVEGLVAATVTVRWTTHAVERDLSVERWFFVDPLVGGAR